MNSGVRYFLCRAGTRGFLALGDPFCTGDLAALGAGVFTKGAGSEEDGEERGGLGEALGSTALDFGLTTAGSRCMATE